MGDFYKNKEIEMREYLTEKFKGKELVLENMGGGTYVANLTDMYFVGGQWRKLYVNRVFYITKERDGLSTKYDSEVNKNTVKGVQEKMEAAIYELLSDAYRMKDEKQVEKRHPSLWHMSNQ